MNSEAKITHTGLRVFAVPTDAPEGDGTFEWSRTTMVVVEVASGATRALGYK
jgi:hypothetical protein